MDKVYNPETKRYVKKDSKKGIEILFKNKDKEILKSFELVNGNIIKKCPENKIRNPKTLRCVNKKDVKKDVKKEDVKKSNSLNRKRNAINKIKKALSPFVKRVSADIYTRVRYLMMMKRELKKVLKNGKGCIRIYKENPDGTFKYRIGHNIILNKRIGSKSVYGEAYLSEFRDKSKKLLTFVSKIFKFDNEKTPKELEILELLTNKVRMSKCPHFPITYGKVICEKLNNRKNDGFKKSNSKDLSIEQNLENYPEIYEKNIKKINEINKNVNGKKKKFILITLFNELANGDLKSFINNYQDYKNNTQLFLNLFVQIFLSIIFFQYHTGMIHNDCHWGNFLYHKIKKGGYFHYKLFGEDFYLENIGFLWVIWDFELATSIKTEYNENGFILVDDFNRIINCILPNYYIHQSYRYKGWNDIIKDENRENMREFFELIYPILNDYIIIRNSNLSIQDLISLMKQLIKYFKDKKWLLTKLPSGERAINKEPFQIGKKIFKNYK